MEFSDQMRRLCPMCGNTVEARCVLQSPSCTDSFTPVFPGSCPIMHSKGRAGVILVSFHVGNLGKSSVARLRRTLDLPGDDEPSSPMKESQLLGGRNLCSFDYILNLTPFSVSL